MFIENNHVKYRSPLDPVDADTLSVEAAEGVIRHLATQDADVTTPMHALSDLAAELGVGSLHIKDEGSRLGLGSFKALGGAYAVVKLTLEEASRRLERTVDVAQLASPAVQSIATGLTVTCATDGNHGRSVAQGAQRVGANAVIFVHSGVSDNRIAAIARFGAKMVRVEGTYDDSVAECARVAADKGWTVVSDTSWPGYERTPGLVMQGYTALVEEALRQLATPPTHVFVQAGVGGIAAAVAGHLAIVLGDKRPTVVVVEPARAACLYESAKAGKMVKIQHGLPTVMAMLECYEPSLVAWRVLTRVADAFMTVDENDAIAVMNRLARPVGNDPPIVAGESGGVGVAGLMQAVADPQIRATLALDRSSHVLCINTEGATDPDRYAELVGMPAKAVLAGRARA